MNLTEVIFLLIEQNTFVESASDLIDLQDFAEMNGLLRQIQYVYFRNVFVMDSTWQRWNICSVYSHTLLYVQVILSALRAYGEKSNDLLQLSDGYSVKLLYDVYALPNREEPSFITVFDTLL